MAFNWGRDLIEGVAPLAGSVDRNFRKLSAWMALRVAPLAGSVDRNIISKAPISTRGRRSPRGERG